MLESRFPKPITKILLLQWPIDLIIVSILGAIIFSPVSWVVLTGGGMVTASNFQVLIGAIGTGLAFYGIGILMSGLSKIKSSCQVGWLLWIFLTVVGIFYLVSVFISRRIVLPILFKLADIHEVEPQMKKWW